MNKTENGMIYVMVHEMGGSKYEAIPPHSMFGPYTKEVAQEVCDKLEKELDSDYFYVDILDVSKSKSKVTDEDLKSMSY